ncbi:MAG: class I SAM-dependent methyltransferase [Candidatus Magasanikbacteria bacterium]|jgi:ubiquinone/menaquinone biosynthesis C-methylase UbiE|nr:class I SAM-dependent methyltransferase [Candidatus Magasanikbacteria bacterium]
MYKNPEIAARFAEREKNEKYAIVARICDVFMADALGQIEGALRVADLGAGAHPSHFDDTFSALLKRPGSEYVWVDAAAPMIDLAKKELVSVTDNRASLITFTQQEMVSFLRDQSAESLDAILMKYTFESEEDMPALLHAIAHALKSGGSAIITRAMLEPMLRSVSTNARYVYKGKEFPIDETRTLEDGEPYGIRFFIESNNPHAGHIEGAEVTSYFRALETIKKQAQEVGLQVQAGDWKDFIIKEKQQGIEMDQAMLILTK